MDAYFAHSEFERIKDDYDYLDGVLEEGAKKVRPTVEELMENVRSATGMGGVSNK